MPRDIPGKLDGLSETDLIRHAVERRNQQLWSKPADYVLNNPRVAELHAAMTQATAPPQPADAAAALQGLLPATAGGQPTSPPMLSPENRRAAIAAYANGTLAEQERLGVPEDRRQALPEDMARDAVRDIAAGDPTDADQRLRDLAADWGSDWPRVLDDLKRAGLCGPYALLAGLDNPIAREGFAKVLAAQATEPGALRTKAGSEADVVDKVLADAIAPMKVSVDGGNIVLAMGPGSGEGGPPPPLTRARKPVPLVDDDGEPVMVWNPKTRQEEQVQIPDGVTLNYFAKIGSGDRNGGWPQQLARLTNFLWGMNWDLQRPGLQRNSSGSFINLSEFRDVSTIAIGVYSAAADIPLEKILWFQSVAANWSNYDPNELISKDHPPLAERNAVNTILGYYLYTSGKIKPK